ncbi:MAG: transcriptional regulator BetI [Methanoregula sp. PtaU1.Bin051]|nr:MAG: transcriptional regulator BetI [Methanoregula sp. PtaU1.Bin051]
MRKPAKDKQEAILKTALTLFTERGFFGTPTSLISKEAGVATGTLFFYFRTKEELIDTLYRRIKGEAAAAMCRGLDKEKGVKEKLHRIGINAVAWATQNPEKMKFMEQFAHSQFVSTTAQEEGMSRFLFLKDLIREGISKGTVKDLDPDLAVSLMASSISGVVARASTAITPAEREEIIGQGLDFVWDGLKA